MTDTEKFAEAVSSFGASAKATLFNPAITGQPLVALVKARNEWEFSLVPCYRPLPSAWPTQSLQAGPRIRMFT